MVNSIVMKNKIKYLRSEVYKFGFYTLVVIVGVLIAFALNDWNENRRLRDLENKLLVDIRDNLIASRISLENDISYNEQTVKYYQKILDHIKEDLPYSNSLDTAFAYISYFSEPKFTYTAYETIKSKGLDMIQNDSLKISITEIYEQYFPFLVGELKGEWEIHQSLVLPFVGKNILYINEEIARPNDFKTLKNDDEFHNLMGLKMITRKYSIQFAETTKEKVNTLIEMIDEELDEF